MRVAVSGASGFVGRHVLGELRRRDVDVVALVRSPDQLDQHPRQLQVRVDLEAPAADDFDRMGQPDVLIHLAWAGLNNFKSPSHLSVELPRQREWLEHLLRAGLGKLCAVGTCLEYGMLSGEQNEWNACEPTVAYAQAKTRLLDQLLSLQGSLGFALTWARLYYVYGPGQAATSLFSQLRSCLLSGRTEFPMSPADQIRDFLPIHCAARNIVDLALAGVDAGVVNVCSGTGVTVEDMVRKWLSDWNAKVELRKGVFPYPDYEPFEFWGSTDKLRRMTSATDVA